MKYRRKATVEAWQFIPKEWAQFKKIDERISIISNWEPGEIPKCALFKQGDGPSPYFTILPRWWLIKEDEDRWHCMPPETFKSNYEESE